MEFEFGDYIWEQDEDGAWQYKLKPKSTKPRSLKSDARYKDAPRYPVVIVYENESKNEFLHNVVDMIKEISKKFVSFKA